MPEQLGVWFERRLAGIIQRSGKVHMTFAYAPDWLASGFPLSLALPLRGEPFSEEATLAFFDNLLPEQGIRARISKQLQISDNNTYGFLERIGGECAGALTILPEEDEPAVKPAYEKISERKLGELILLLPRRPLLAGEDGIRLSLAGAQHKLPVTYLDGQYYLPANGSPSTHIIKPPIDDLEGSVENEAFCMILARIADVAVPEVDILETYPRAYMVKRYDRVIEPLNIVRIHQEDFCQAMGLPATLKYQNEGGPEIRQCFDLLRHCEDPGGDKNALLRLIVFNHLIGNTDAHAKNFSLLYAFPPKPRLAPFYDLLCLGVYPGLATKNAMKIGGEYDPQFTMHRHWLRLADDAGVSDEKVVKLLKTMTEHLPMMAAIAAEEFQRTYGKSRIVPKIVDFITARCELVRGRVED